MIIESYGKKLKNSSRMKYMVKKLIDSSVACKTLIYIQQSQVKSS